jgi:hypothetical protein
MSRCELGFTLRPVKSQQDLHHACDVRAQAYGHHLPELLTQLGEPDEIDRAAGTTVFLCRDKAEGGAIGTMRIQTSAFGPVMMERSVELPAWLAREPRAEITRLAVRVGVDPLTRLSLMKASYLFCMAHRVRWMVIGARNEALIRNYRRLGFFDVFGAEELQPLGHTGGLPHRIMAFDVAGARRAWQAAQHPLYGFMVETVHPDLQLLPVGTGNLRWPAWPGTQPQPAAA